MLHVPGIAIPGHTAVAPPGQTEHWTFFEAELISKFSMLKHPQSSR
ncbi:MAG: hypothetical protein AB7H80_17160 [Candidatus Kapaibacterium sp.]